MDSVAKIATDCRISTSQEEEEEEENLSRSFLPINSQECLGIFAGEVYPRSGPIPSALTGGREDEEDDDSSDCGNPKKSASRKRKDRMADNDLGFRERKAKRFLISRRKPECREGSRLDRSDGADLGSPQSTAVDPPRIDNAGGADAVDASTSQAEKDPCFFTASDSLTTASDGAADPPQDLAGEVRSPPGSGNAESLAGRNQGLLKSQNAFPAKFASKDLPPNPAVGVSASKPGLEGVVFKNPRSDAQFNAKRNLPGKDESSNPLQYPPLKLFKKALAAEIASSSVDALQKLPPSIENPLKDKMSIRACNDAKGIGERKENLTVKKLLDAVVVLSKESNRNIGDEDILEVAKRTGYSFPQPRWWRSGGYL